MSTVNIGPGPIAYEISHAGDGGAGLAPLVFLHEGLGSVGLWRDVPSEVRVGSGAPTTLVYSRHGYGRSARAPEPWRVSFMHDEALVILPELLGRLGIHRPILVGHSDGASIALIHAGAAHPVAGLVLLAPHVFVEDCTLAGIRATREEYQTRDLRGRLARHHDDVDATFESWTRVWLDPEFRTWNIEASLSAITAPILVVQGNADPYGTVAQARAIERRVAGPVQTMVLEGVGHAPHVEAHDAVVSEIIRFVRACGRSERAVAGG